MTQLQHNPSQRAAVEQIVRRVLAELRAGKMSTQGVQRPTSASQLVLTNKVVSTAELEGRLSGVTHLIVPRGAVLTPAARDELRKHRITIASAISSDPIADEVVLQVAVVETEYNPQPLWQALRADGLSVESTVSCDLTSAVAVLTAAVGAGRSALLVTQRLAPALCLANRIRGVRAALATNWEAVDAATKELGANFLVIDPTGRSVFEMQRAIRHWLRAGRPTCPPEFAGQLT